MISANGDLPAHRYTPQVTPRWPRGSEPASVEPLGNLDKSYTVRTPRGLFFNASYACTNMHRVPNFSFYCLILHNLTNHKRDSTRR